VERLPFFTVMTLDRLDPAPVPTPLDGFATDVLAALYVHRLLTTAQIHRLFGSEHVSWTQRRLRRLVARGLVVEVRGPFPGRERRWFLSELGAALAEDGGDVPVRSYRVDQHRATSRYAEHLMAVNEVGVLLVEAARRHGDSFGPLSWVHEVMHSFGTGNRDQLSADALVIYDVLSRNGLISEHRFIELDRGTEPVHALTGKLLAYSEFFRWEPSRREAHMPRSAWKRSYAAFPGVVFVLADNLSDGALRRRTDELLDVSAGDARLQGLPFDAVVVRLADLRERGPFEPIATRLLTEDEVPLFRRA
jgi:DNA-binding MarR family transcriptional regulator